MKIWSLKEKLLIPAALLLAVLFDRLMIVPFVSMSAFVGGSVIFDLPVAWAIFWLCYLAVLYLMFWGKLKKDPVLWVVAVCSVALGIWNFIFMPHSNEEYRMITMLVIPGILMAHAQWAAGRFTLKNYGGMATAWLIGWLIKPFSGIWAIFGVSGALLENSNTPMIKRTLAGCGAAIVLLAVIIPLLMSADQVFRYFMGRIFSIDFSIVSAFGHGVAIIIIFALFYSFLWNIDFGENTAQTLDVSKQIDRVISCIVLGSVILVYVLFCLVQFTFLFARAGLPAGMTYAEYARQGFAQTVVVCAINLMIFGVFLRFGVREKLLKILLSGLLVLTGIMLFSGGVRLGLYIGTFGMTWLRLLSAWFIIYLAAVIKLCAVKLFAKKQLPVIALSALLLLVWYVALGFLNPDGFISWYNML